MSARTAVRGAARTVLAKAAGVRLSEGHGLTQRIEPAGPYPLDYEVEAETPAAPIAGKPGWIASECILAGSLGFGVFGVFAGATFIAARGL